MQCYRRRDRHRLEILTAAPTSTPVPALCWRRSTKSGHVSPCPSLLLQETLCAFADSLSYPFSQYAYYHRRPLQKFCGLNGEPVLGFNPSSSLLQLLDTEFGFLNGLSLNFKIGKDQLISACIRETLGWLWQDRGTATTMVTALLRPANSPLLPPECGRKLMVLWLAWSLRLVFQA